jgi:hypothetical protein
MMGGGMMGGGMMGRTSQMMEPRPRWLHTSRASTSPSTTR